MSRRSLPPSGPSRRLFLQGAGAALALPLFESLVPRTARANATPPQRFLAYYLPCGINMSQWTPAAPGPKYPLSPTLSSLAPVASKVSVLTGLANRPAQPDGGGDHASGTAAFLTAMHPFKTDGSNIMNGVSIDQVIASAIAGKTPFSSIQLGTEGGSSAGGCDTGYSCAYARNISWAGPAQPLPKLTNPQVVFDHLFGGVDPTETAAQARRRLAYKTSILDYLRDDTARLRGRLGQTDQRKLDEYVGGVRALEKRLQDSASAPMCTPGARAADPTPDWPTLARLMADLMVVCFQCDLTRVITFMLGNAGSNIAYPFIGVPGAHHELSHHMGDPTKLAQIALIDAWEVQQFANLCARLDGILEADGKSILYHSLLYLSGEICDGNAHNHDNMPVLVAGSASGAIKGVGQHVVYAQERSFADLYVTFQNAFGVPATSFGMNSTAPLPGLT